MEILETFSNQNKRLQTILKNLRFVFEKILHNKLPKNTENVLSFCFSKLLVVGEEFYAVEQKKTVKIYIISCTKKLFFFDGMFIN